MCPLTTKKSTTSKI
uniref:Uncharacterized protein n=1 Tax=Rhizophora mucronata TaxID=61149 RepID=A0A2P2JFF0_RHIMU